MKNTNKQYTKYIPQFKNSCVFKISASALALLSILLLPIFQITFGTFVISEFSVFDLIKNIVDMFLNSSIGYDYFLAYYFYLFAILYGLVALIMIMVEIIKSIGRIFDLDSYALETYDQIKARVDLKENKRRRPFNPVAMLVVTLIFFIMGVFMEKLFNSINSGFGMEGTSSQLLSISDIIFDKNGYSIPMVCILVIAFIGTIVLNTLSNSYEKKLSLAIIKEDYGIQDTALASTSEKHEKSTFEQIRELKELLDMGAITQEEFDTQKSQLLSPNTVDSESDA